jgi:hypothetical protein
MAKDDRRRSGKIVLVAKNEAAQIALDKTRKKIKSRETAQRIYSSAVDRMLSETGLDMSVRKRSKATADKAYALMKKYKDQIMKRFSGLTAGMLPPTEITRYLTNIQYINRPSMSHEKYRAEVLGSEGEPSVNPENRILYGQISNPWANDERIRDNTESLSQQYASSGSFGSVLQSRANTPASVSDMSPSRASPVSSSPSSSSPLNPRALPFLSAARGAQMYQKMI